MNNYPIHSLVHKDFKFIKVNSESRGNLVPKFTEYTKPLAESLAAFVIDLKPNSQSAIKLKYTDEICLSNYDLTAQCIGSKLCFAFEEHWQVI